MRAATWSSGTRIVWRPLLWGEYKRLQASQGTSAERAMEVYKLCLVDGPIPEEVPAGAMMFIALEELEKSPFSGTFQAISLPLERAREKVSGTFLLSAQAFIASVLRVSFEAMETWDSQTFLTRLAQAEFIAGVPLNPMDPSSAQSAQKVKRAKKPLTPAQQTAIERRQDDKNNPVGTSKVIGRPSTKSKL